MHAHMLQKTFETSVQHNTCNFLLGLLIRRICPPIEQGRLLARDPRSAASKEKLLLRIQAIWKSFQQADIQDLLHSMPRRIAAIIVARGGYTKY
ncbi:uncharacterized protein TNCV_736701 [Trichonephila clavipes]|nr:uncharacterized protein TNCV_736701 [Trichonephila clavipes]